MYILAKNILSLLWMIAIKWKRIMAQISKISSHKIISALGRCEMYNVDYVLFIYHLKWYLQNKMKTFKLMQRFIVIKNVKDSFFIHIVELSKQKLWIYLKTLSLSKVSVWCSKPVNLLYQMRKDTSKENSSVF